MFASAPGIAPDLDTALAWAHPVTREWFLGRFGSPTEPQIAGWPAILRGEATLISAPTGSGKTFVAQLALQAAGRSALVVVPTLDLLHQWYAGLRTAFPGVEVGLLGGGSRDRDAPLLVAT